jgi:hypothetical protein
MSGYAHVRNGVTSGNTCGEQITSGLLLIVLKKSKMPRQQNSRKSELIVDFAWRCPLRACGKATLNPLRSKRSPTSQNAKRISGS